MAEKEKNIKLSEQDKELVMNLAAKGLCIAYIAAEIDVDQEDLELNYMNLIHRGRAKIWEQHGADIMDKMTDDHNFFRMLLPIVAPELSEAENYSNSNTVHVKIHKGYADDEE